MLLIICILVLFAFAEASVSDMGFPRKSRYGNGAGNENIPLPRSNPLTSDNIDYRLIRLEVQVGEKAEAIHSELRETNRRLQALEWQNADIHSALETSRAELQRFSSQQTPLMSYVPPQVRDTNLEERIENLAKATASLIVNVRSMSADMTTIKNNISAIANNSSQLLDVNKNLLTKQTFNDGLLELRTSEDFVRYQSSPHLIKSTKELPKDCRDVQEKISKKSGVYRIQPEHSTKSFMVYCDLETRGGGWVVIQNRYEGAQDFYQGWHDFKYGFGNLGGEFWLGLNNIYQLTGYEVSELLVELEDFLLAKSYAHYGAFSIGPEVEGYPLKVLGGYSGDAGDSLIYHAGNRFSTKDMDQDAWPEGSCAQAHGGGWWYRGCDTSNLNGRYLSGELPEQYIYQGMYWGEFRGAQYSLSKARMLVRSRDHSSPPMFSDVYVNETDSN